MKSFEEVVQIAEREERAITYFNQLTFIQVNSYRLSGRRRWEQDFTAKVLQAAGKEFSQVYAKIDASILNVIVMDQIYIWQIYALSTARTAVFLPQNCPFRACVFYEGETAKVDFL